MTNQGTSRTQFKACLTSERTRLQIGISLTDSEALHILASDELTDDWYMWWLRRPPTEAIEMHSEVESPAIPPAQNSVSPDRDLNTITAGSPSSGERWKLRRAKMTWLVGFLTVVLSLVVHWLAQIFVGGLVGGLVGRNGLLKILQFDALNTYIIVIEIFVIASVTLATTIRTYEDRAWSGPGNSKVRLDWWANFWVPILIGTFVYGLLFGLLWLVISST